MAIPFLAVGVGATLAKGAMQYGMAQSAAGKTEAMGRRAARRAAIEGRERMRQLSSAQDEMRGTTQALQAASGFAGDDATSRSVLGEMDQEFKIQRDFMRLQDNLTQHEILSGAQSQANQIRQQGQFQLASSGLQAFTQAGQANDWWMS